MGSPAQSNAERVPDVDSSGIETLELSHAPVDTMAQQWLDAQCSMLAGTSLGVVFSSTSINDPVVPIARWPQGRSTVAKLVLDAAHSALSKNTCVIMSPDNDESDPVNCFVASPLNQDESCLYVAVFELPYSIRRQQQAAIQLLQWGTVWFDLLKKRQLEPITDDRLKTVVELLASSLEHSEFEAAATTAATELAVKLSCARVSLGMHSAGTVRVCAISNSSRVDTRLNLTRSISAAMNEAVDQGATLTWPQSAQDLPYVTLAQATLARHSGQGICVLSTPLYDGGVAIGALTLESESGIVFDQRCRDVCETLAVLLGPVVALKRDKEQPIVKRMLASCSEFVSKLFGRNRVALKFYTLSFLIVVALFSFLDGEYRITSQARLDGSMKRVITAPLDGFIASAEQRAGDVVSEGELLAQLDDQELRLQQLQLASQSEQLNKEHRTALTSHDRSATAIIAARKQQIDAQLSLIRHQLSRTQLIAPFDGVVVSGDLSQRIGSPVENGQILFEIAPLDNYRVVLEVDERDIGDVAEAQSGVLTLTGLPDSPLAFTVSRIVPLSTPRDGRNFFEVQAELESPIELLRPGMEGVGKIKVDQRKLIWVWTHELVNWLRLSLWTWIS